MKPQDIADLLNEPDVRGEIVKSLAFVEWAMDSLIEVYFTTDNRRDVFSELIIERLNFNAKLSIIEKIPFKRKYRSRDNIKIIRDLQQLRNVVAHARHLSERDKKIQNPKWSYLLKDYPRCFNDAVIKARWSLGRLTSTKEVWGPYYESMHKSPNQSLKQ